MREITDHRVNPVNDVLSIIYTDAPGAGGAHHHYVVSGFDLSKNPSAFGYESGCVPAAHGHVHSRRGSDVSIVFQNGPIAEVGANGVTHEALLAVLIDRLRCFQAGPYASQHNADALAQIEGALNSLKARTLARMARGVEGTSTV